MPARNIKSVHHVDTPARGADLAPYVDAGKYSAHHQDSIAILRPWFAKTQEQEDIYVAAGFPAAGITRFLSEWFDAWLQHSAEGLREMVTDDIVWAEPVFGHRETRARQVDFDMYNIAFKWAPDCAFYPRGVEAQHLCYFDFTDGVVRITLPWLMVARGRVTPRTVKVFGVDRYVLVRDAADENWLVQRIDSEFDLSIMAGQLIPFFPIRGLNESLVYAAVKVATRIAPSLRSNHIRPLVWDNQ
ncbi:hypothetical protein AB0N05_09045 [Nocardia sp. NPDC051030]|uniref:hypothetical protein n=1 Tax=Nocardia sp. NPDC051030 TaxID=3155162 RepID=UPI00341C7267